MQDTDPPPRPICEAPLKKTSVDQSADGEVLRGLDYKCDGCGSQWHDAIDGEGLVRVGRTETMR